jgi:spore germination cell wall hydrolase CwlJ-like protein
LKFGTQARAEGRALLSAALIGSGVGLGLGASYLVAGMAGHAAEHARAQQIADAAANGYMGSYLEAQGQGLRMGLERYGFASDAAPAVVPSAGADRPTAKTRRRADLECLTEAVYYEARGESPRGQYAVAQVVMNRVKHPAFPKSVCAVVFQGAGRRGCQFSFACDGSMRRGREAMAWNRARKVATRALAGAALADIGSATHFHTTGVSPAWGPQMLRVAMVGTHVFYKFAPYRLRAPASPLTETAVLISAPAPTDAPELRLAPAIVEKAVEGPLQPAAANAPVEVKITPPPAAPSKPAEAASISQVSAGAS